jgi:hypothetical protein
MTYVLQVHVNLSRKLDRTDCDLSQFAIYVKPSVANAAGSSCDSGWRVIFAAITRNEESALMNREPVLAVKCMSLHSTDVEPSV